MDFEALKTAVGFPETSRTRHVTGQAEPLSGARPSLAVKARYVALRGTVMSALNLGATEGPGSSDGPPGTGQCQIDAGIQGN